MFSFLTYCYLKTVAVLLRSIVALGGRIAGRPVPRPDEVRHIASRDPWRTIKIHVYHPAKSIKGPRPVLINFHGSGFLLPMHGSDTEFCQTISNNTQYAVLDVPYRLAPENPFPAALNDVEDAIKYALLCSKEFDRTRISLSGFSAGGNLVLAASATLFPPNTFHALIAFYPALDLASDAATKVAPDPKGRVIPIPVARLFNRCYVPPGVDRRDPRISPKYADLERFPHRMLMITAEGDSLALEGEDLAKNLEKLPGRHVVSERMAGCNHAWDKRTRAGTPQREARDRAYAMAVDMLNEA
ncbi:putative esterase/lipase [Penicillium brasilianum]|uniref:Putative esterase/lipase n=1 Tax=Penicillium brasilianum TaxID=104259 RepID=A0A1S9RHT2_PENBI|nr:putative esterase/lipase [Penicillium brasilianum]